MCLGDAYTWTEEDALRARLRARLRILESDQKDSHDPKVLARWPNLGDPELIKHIQNQINEIKRRLGEGT